MSSVCFKDTEGAGLLQTAGAELAARSVNSDSGTLLLCARAVTAVVGGVRTWASSALDAVESGVVEVLGGLRVQSPC